MLSDTVISGLFFIVAARGGDGPVYFARSRRGYMVYDTLRRAQSAAKLWLRERRKQGHLGDRCRVIGLQTEGALADVWEDHKHSEVVVG